MVQFCVRLCQVSLHVFDHLLDSVFGGDNRQSSLLHLRLKRVYLLLLVANGIIEIFHLPFKLI